MAAPLALYIHIPFCAVRCHYCDFNTYAGLEGLFEPYTAALETEIRLAGQARGRPPVHTLFIGGGTPTVLSSALLERILLACREAFDIAEDAEITSEANPGTVDQPRFAALRQLGVNRLSMGVQSFDDQELRWLGRIHSAREAETAFHAARAAGFANINLDFMFGLPEQQPATWQQTLSKARALSPEHLSLYSLIVEPGTPLADWVRRGLVPEPEDDLAADLYIDASEILGNQGYVQYEISNWAHDAASDGAGQPALSNLRNPHYASQHNLVYWRHQPYLGFGAGAHSFEGERRWWNVRPVPDYIRRIAENQSAERDSELITAPLAMGETMMLGLRLVIEGANRRRFENRFGTDLVKVYSQQIEDLSRRGLLELLPDRLRLTPAGRLLGNQVFAEFLPET